MKDHDFILPISNIDVIKQLIPHREPMIMVDGLLHFEGRMARATLTILKENIFIENNRLSETGLLEHMAQTAALHTGYKFKSKNKNVKEGMIAAIKSASILNVPQVNDTIISEVYITYEAEMLSMVSITTTLHDDIIASAQMNTVLKD
ncbi:hypothetical protein ES676_07885 [Bizionia saleffrena]|uniref:3-hydroxyacyl-ACP dehydratase n=1 Tax=Bizionia saleffrena TaxID=291189 RepID=A0A8H2LES5_9FLAO|nr:hypothetical protein [Bizionia saleffrena]TYB74094.1 hypothetical protein ES676_07885 [Bizionia saleffrena]